MDVIDQRKAERKKKQNNENMVDQRGEKNRKMQNKASDVVYEYNFYMTLCETEVLHALLLLWFDTAEFLPMG